MGTGLIETTTRGYRRGLPVERAGLGMLTSCAVSITCARVINYVRERRRPAPRLRSWVRRAQRLPRRERLRIHHFVPGVALGFLSGAEAIIQREDGRELWLSLPFGTGVGLTLDEIAVMTERQNPYWRSERLAIAQAASAALGAFAVAVRLHHRGRGSAE